MNPSDCLAIFAQLSEYLDRELPAATCEELERHIQDCEPCVAFLESLKKSVRLCREYRPAGGSPPIAEGVKTKLRKAYARMLASR